MEHMKAPNPVPANTDILILVCEAIATSDFDPNMIVDPEVEAFLRINIIAHRDDLPKFLAHCIMVSLRQPQHTKIDPA